MKRFLTLFMALLCSITTLAIAPEQTEQNPKIEYSNTLSTEAEKSPVTSNLEIAEKQTEGTEVTSIEPTESITKEDTTVNAQFSSKQITPKAATTSKQTPTDTANPDNNEQKESATSSGKQITATITHYCACSKCNGKYSYTDSDGAVYCSTAGGVRLYNGRANGNYCAANFGKLGDKITINGTTYTIIDRFGNSAGAPKVDIFVSEGHSACMQKGRQTGVTVTLH